MATKMAPGFGPIEMTDGYSIMGSQANSVALKPAGTLSGGKRFSVAGPIFGAWSPSNARARRPDNTADAISKGYFMPIHPIGRFLSSFAAGKHTRNRALVNLVS